MGTVYWTQLKSGELRSHDNPPKSRPYVADHREREADPQICHHMLQPGNMVLRPGDAVTTHFTSRCGYDRGPKLHAKIRSLLEQG